MINTFNLAVAADTAFYEKWNFILKQKGFAADFFRSFRWSIIELLLRLCNACEKLLSSANLSIKFITSTAVQNFISQWKPIIFGILIVSILIFGFALMTNSKHDRSKLLQSIILSLLVVMGSTTLIAQLTNMTSQYNTQLINYSNSSSSEGVVKGNIVDLYYLDANNWSDAAYESKNNISNINYIDINSTIKASNNLKSPDIFTKYLDTDENGRPILLDIDDGGLVDFNNNTYYRYHIDFITIIITLFSTIIVIIFVSFKTVKITLEIVVNHIMLPLLAAADWQTGQKLKEIIKSTLGLFFSIFMCTVCVKLYYLYSAYLSNNKSFDNAFIKAILLVFGAFFVIDGPNIVEKIFGVDAGLASTFRSVSTMFFAARGAMDLAKGTNQLLNLAARGATHAGGFVHGFNNALRNPDNCCQQDTNNNAFSGSSTNSNTSVSADTNSDASSATNPNNSNNNNPNPTNSTPSVANRANEGRGNNNDTNGNDYNYWGNKAKRGSSTVGAAVRGARDGTHIGNSVANRINRALERHASRHNIEE